jgi:hypothetical protein
MRERAHNVCYSYTIRGENATIKEHNKQPKTVDETSQKRYTL